MKIAFVGKGGSGKTTLTASWIRFLQSKGAFVMAVDADINVGLASAIPVVFRQDAYLSHPETAYRVRAYLRGENTRIETVDHFVKTTPPALGSRIVREGSQQFFDDFCSYQDDNLKFFHVGTYETDGIGVSCYHTHLSVFENLLSHTYLGKNAYFVVDMVAGNDAFSNTLYAQFDILCLIVEPTHESVSMVKNYQKLLESSGSMTKLFLIANKMEGEQDMMYISDNDIIPDSVFSYDSSIKRSRQQGTVYVSSEHLSAWEKLYEYTEHFPKNDDKKLKSLHDLHRKYSMLEYIRSPLGDISHQIDPDFPLLGIQHKSK